MFATLKYSLRLCGYLVSCLFSNDANWYLVFHLQPSQSVSRIHCSLQIAVAHPMPTLWKTWSWMSMRTWFCHRMIYWFGMRFAIFQEIISYFFQKDCFIWQCYPVLSYLWLSVHPKSTIAFVSYYSCVLKSCLALQTISSGWRLIVNLGLRVARNVELINLAARPIYLSTTSSHYTFANWFWSSAVFPYRSSDSICPARHSLVQLPASAQSRCHHFKIANSFTANSLCLSN